MMKKTFSILAVILMTFFVVACKKDKESDNSQTPTNSYLNPNLKYGSVSDIDGNKYATIEIGLQVWMAENLRTTKYNDGTIIPNVIGGNDWSKLNTGAYSIYDNFSENKQIYGLLYNWYAVGSSKLCPIGWHIPTYDEWKVLMNSLINNIGGKLKATGNNTDKTGLWKNPNLGATNESGFTALPAGSRSYYDGNDYYINSNSDWWSSTEKSKTGAWTLYVNYENSKAGIYDYNKGMGFSCRCIKD